MLPLKTSTVLRYAQDKPEGDYWRAETSHRAADWADREENAGKQ
jgi:hypothetical protein